MIEIDGYHPEKVVDTLAAGDCFIAASIHFLNEGVPPEKALALSTKIAGIKVGQRGLGSLHLEWLESETV